MRRQWLVTNLTVALFVMTLFSPLTQVEGSTINSDTTWSGNITLESDVVVSPGATLTIEPGTVVDGGSSYAIEVFGTLIAESAHFFSSASPTAQSSHGQGLWQGIVVKTGGSASLNDVIIENTNVGVKSEGTLDADNLTVKDSYLGINNMAVADITEFSTNSIDYEAIMNSGVLILTTSEITNASTGIESSGTTHVTSSNFSKLGTGIKAIAGDVTIAEIDFQEIAVGISTVSGVEFTGQHITGNAISLLADLSNSDDFTISHVNISGNRLSKSTGASNTLFSNVSFTGSESISSPAIEADCYGACTFANVSIRNSNYGAQLLGNGDHRVVNSTFEGINTGIKVASQGTILIDNLTVTAQHNGITIRDGNTRFVGHTNVSMTAADSIGVDILGGIHQFSNLIVDKSYIASDFTSIGCQIWYAEFSSDNLSTENFSTGVTMRDTEFSSTNLANIGGNTLGTEIIDSHATVYSISTKFQDSGVILSESSRLSSYQWTAQLHNQPLQVSSGSTAHVLDFNTVNTNPSFSDASGQGTVYYGFDNNLDISSAESDYFVLTNVKFTDMSNNPVQAVINVNTFQFTSDENGEVLIPLFTSGSKVTASLAGTGISESLNGGLGGQVVRIPVIPNGDWILSGNQSISLQSLDTSQSLVGNLILEDEAILQLFDMNLIMAPGKAIILSDNAQIIGANSSIESDEILLNDSSAITGVSSHSQLLMDADIEWNCGSQTNVSNLIVVQQLTLGPNCQLTIANGILTGTASTPIDSSIKITSTLSVSVVDRGLPISNAVIEFQNNDYFTDLSGDVSIESIARLIDSQGDFVGTNENVLLKLSGYNELITWNTSSAKSHQFIVSSVDVDAILSSDMTLESVWSPYFLESDITIPLGRTLTIVDDVSLRISDGVQITILGTLDAQSATFSSTGFGARWSGLIMDSQYSTTHLLGTTLLEASPAITYNGGSLIAEEVSVSRSASSRALIEINEQHGGTFSLINSHLSDASGACIDIVKSIIEIEIVNVQFDRCNGPAVRAENAHLNIVDVVIGQGSSDGLMLSSVVGEIVNIDATEFNGFGSIVKMNYINGGLLISNVSGTVGGTAALSGSNNRALNLESINLSGAPAIDFDASAGLISDVVLIGNGYGTAIISHHGRYSDPLRLANVELSGYAVGIDLHADGPDTASPFEITNAVVDASTALSIEDYPLSVEKSSIIGATEISGLIEVNMIDVQISQEPSIYDGAVTHLYQTLSMESRYLNITKPTDYVIDLVYSDESISTIEASGTTALAVIGIATKYAQSISNIYLDVIEIKANSAGHPTESITLSQAEFMDLNTTLTFTLKENQAPQIQSTSPNSTSVIMQTKPFESTIDAVDDFDDVGAMTYQWRITDDTGSEVYSHTSSNPSDVITLESPGSFLLKLVVIDTNLAQSEQIIPIEVLLLDSDNDYITTCNSASWFDLSASRSCGPDVYDDDDDNDGIIDSRDYWPLDACAWQDTDGDGQPDNINCPEGLMTNLFEDQDDDGDGIPDTLEGVSDGSNEEFDLFTLILIIIGLGVVVLFVLRSRQGMQE